MPGLVRIGTICCLLLGMRLFPVAQSLFVVKHLGAADGLADPMVSDIIQDRRGFIWMATDNGLQKYDGYQFVTFHHIPGDTTTLPSNSVTRIIELSNGKFLVACGFQGICLFDPATGRRQALGNPRDTLLRRVDFVSSVAVGPKGHIWMTGQGSLLEFCPTTGRLRSYDSLFRGKLTDPFLSEITFDQEGRLWLRGARSTLFLLDIRRDRLYHFGYNPDNLAAFRAPFPVTFIFLDRDDRLWMGSEDAHLYRYDIRQNRMQEIPYPKGDMAEPRIPDINRCFEDAKGNVWLYGGDQRFFRYDAGRGATVPVTDNFTTGGMTRPNLLAVLEDRDGYFWMASDNGVSVADPGGARFTFHSGDPFHRIKGTSKETVSLFQSGNGDVWMTSYGGGLLRMDSNLVPKKHWMFGRAGVGDTSDRSWVVAEPFRSDIWISFQHGWMSHYDPSHRRMKVLRPPELAGRTAMSMAPDRQGNLWMGLYEGLAYRDRRTGAFRRFDGQLPYRNFYHSSIPDMWIDSSGLIWVATVSMGLQVFDPRQGRFIRQYEPSDTGNQALSSSQITCMDAIDDTTLALGMETGGIDFFNTRTGRATYLTTEGGLPSNNIVALDARSPGYLWVGTVLGVCRVRLKDKRVAWYGGADGLGPERVTGIRFCRLRDGRCLIGCQGGFYSFFPDSIPDESLPSNVYITSVHLDGNAALDSARGRLVSVTLPYRQNEIGIDYVSLNYINATTVRYAYQLSGFDPDWVEAGMDRSVRYHGLPPGHYTFRVRCENQDGISCASISSFEVTVLPPFWRTSWFVALCVLSLGSMTYLAYRDRINRIKNRQELRNRIAGDLHDDIGSTLSGINIYSRMALRQMEASPGESAGLLAKISDRSEKMMEALSDIVWSINSRNDHLDNVLARMKEYSSEMLEPQQIAWTLQVDENVGRLELDMVERKEFYMIFKEALNNAAKYAQCTEIGILLRKEERFLVMALRDNGVGFDRGKVGSGNGLYNMQNRARKLKGQLAVESAPGAGTRVILRMPLG